MNQDKTANIIDCDAQPIIPDDWEVVEHQKGGKLDWNPAKILLYLSKGQKESRDKVLNACVDFLRANLHILWEVVEHQKLDLSAPQLMHYLSERQKQKEGRHIEGNKLRKKLKGKKVLNACVLDFLLANPHLIPEGWKGKRIFFWGTIYQLWGGRSGTTVWVRYLYWNDTQWEWASRPLVDNWYTNDPAAVLQSDTPS